MPTHPLQPFFRQRGWKPFPFQKETWAAHAAGKSGLLHAPTGLGKTLAVWGGPLIEHLVARTHTSPTPCSVLWITPLRALAHDTLRALREPLELLAPDLKVEARTGDTSAAIRARLRKKLPFALITTPESLSLMLTHPETREHLAGLKSVIVDEWHELLATKRGVQTELCLARLRAWLPGLRIWGLSATLGNLDQARDALLGDQSAHAITLSADLKKDLRIETLIPPEIDRFPWAGHLGTRLAPQVVAEIEKSATTLVFTNTRSQTEIWHQELLALRPAWKDRLAMHHGSLDRTEREAVEQGLRDGTLRCVVCTSSLDLGVDFSPVDQVIQVGSPKGVARLLQRAGRSGHQPGKSSRLLGVPTHALELVEFAAARDAAQTRDLETRPPLLKPLDVLVQHLVTCAIGEAFDPAEMLREIRSTHAFHSLDDTEWHWAIHFISNGGKALAAYPRYQKARLENGRFTVDDPRLIQQHRLSIGTISADPQVSVRFANGQNLGSVEEGFVSRLKPGSLLIFAGRKLELVRFHQKIATVRPARRDGNGQVAIWGGSKMPLSSELANAMAARLRGEGTPTPEMKAIDPILAIQRRWSTLPDNRSLLVEHTRSRDAEHLFFYPMSGRLVHEGLGALMAYRLQLKDDVTVTQNDYGFCLSARRGLHLDEKSIRSNLSVENLLEDLVACLNTAELARRQFREVARVAGLVLQPLPGRQQRGQRELQSSARLLFEVLERYDPDNLLLQQSQREILEKQLEFSRLRHALIDLQQRPIHLVETERLTPMAFPLWADRLSALLPAGDAATRLEQMLAELNRAARL
ncbi:MAG: ligase-associated DNA damage response DEXH box helicase [Verrucomicrobia bacterium]|nr:MAG: ligase-associated DNA damage response DEXH box helicase [Verrucomicrobiota bacterium]TAE86102.1 MAG: ligase-associated DNA damage response DEXH box helicase [Verrucomicrobiota bacterium]TAF23449.1 MAG: ligase-associated DNA damage response DEXH box helicase [Verrucomicrobiota bacterium]TAF40079.1 MAG: ligase-associated DNA damage response DEXH box helicase [Verrucomicrobiota bacterium]